MAGRSLVKRVLDILFPPRCMFCRRVIDDGHICKQCLADLPRCGEVRTRGEFYSRCVAPLYYRDAVRRAMMAYKFNGRRSYAGGFAGLMARCVREEMAGEFDIVTWVPVSAKRLHKRGYDQSGLLAQATARELGVPCERLITKTRHTKPNSSLTGRESRAANVLGAFTAADGADIRDRRVLLIDDIVTTGATLSECARVLLMAGAEDVVCAAACAAAKNKK